MANWIVHKVGVDAFTKLRKLIGLHGVLGAGSTTQADETRERNEDNIQDVVPHLNCNRQPHLHRCRAERQRGSNNEAKIQKEVRK